MAVGRERGILVSSAVMIFEHEGLALNLVDTPATSSTRWQPPRLTGNLLDTPGHQDLSEDLRCVSMSAEEQVRAAPWGDRSELLATFSVYRSRKDVVMAAKAADNCAYRPEIRNVDGGG